MLCSIYGTKEKAFILYIQYFQKRLFDTGSIVYVPFWNPDLKRQELTGQSQKFSYLAQHCVLSMHLSLTSNSNKLTNGILCLHCGLKGKTVLCPQHHIFPVAFNQ
jgi:hypothetical protein